MTDQDDDQEKSAEEQVAKTFAKRVETIQERARREDFVANSLDDKAFMDEAWGETATICLRTSPQTRVD